MAALKGCATGCPEYGFGALLRAARAQAFKPARDVTEPRLRHLRESALAPLPGARRRPGGHMTERTRRTAVSLALLVGALAPAGPIGQREKEPAAGVPRIERLDPALDALLDAGVKVEVLASGFNWSEGPVWVREGAFLLFSDVPENVVYRWKEGEGAREWLKPSGYTGQTPRGGEPGSNGLALDPQGRLVLCQHGDRRIARLDAPLSAPAPRFTSLADRYDGARFSSPNDLVYHSSGALYFTDPPYGLEKGVDDPAREIAFHGVYRRSPTGTVTLVTKEMTRPNGIAFSPDEKTLYVAQSDPTSPVWRAFEMQPDGTVGRSRVLFDGSGLAKSRKGLPDGLKVDVSGHLFATGPGGVLILTPDGRHLGTILTGQATGNVAFGEDGRSLFITADMHLMRVRLKTNGTGF